MLWPRPIAVPDMARFLVIQTIVSEPDPVLFDPVLFLAFDTKTEAPAPRVATAETVTPKRRGGDWFAKVDYCHATSICTADTSMKVATLFLTVALALLTVLAFATHPANGTFTSQVAFGGASEGTGTLQTAFREAVPVSRTAKGPAEDLRNVSRMSL